MCRVVSITYSIPSACQLLILFTIIYSDLLYRRGSVQYVQETAEARVACGFLSCRCLAALTIGTADRLRLNLFLALSDEAVSRRCLQLRPRR